MSNLAEVLKHKKQEILKYYEKLGADADYWSDEVNTLYQQIRAWLKPLSQEGLLSFEQHSEEHEIPLVGRRGLEFLTIKFFNGQTVSLKNVGLHIGGAFGRLEMKLGLRVIKIVLNEKKGYWTMLERGKPREPEITYEFNQENFEQLLTQFVENF